MKKSELRKIIREELYESDAAEASKMVRVFMGSKEWLTTQKMLKKANADLHKKFNTWSEAKGYDTELSEEAWDDFISSWTGKIN